MKTVLYILAAVVLFLGIMFLAGSQGLAARLVVGVILIAAALAMVYVARAQSQVSKTETTIIQKIELSGDVSMEKLSCQNCGAPITDDFINVKAGAIFVDCVHCGTHYQLEEEPKW